MPTDYDTVTGQYQQERQRALNEWTQANGLKRSTSRLCCARWLLNNRPRPCSWNAKPYSHGPRPHLDHPSLWTRNGRPAVVTSSPYPWFGKTAHQVDTEFREKLRAFDDRLRVAWTHDTGWYGYGTMQVAVYNADVIDSVSFSRVDTDCRVMWELRSSGAPSEEYADYFVPRLHLAGHALDEWLGVATGPAPKTVPAGPVHVDYRELRAGLAVSNAVDPFDGFPPATPPRPEGRTVDCPHCGSRCADPYSDNFASLWGCEGLLDSTSAVSP